MYTSSIILFILSSLSSTSAFPTLLPKDTCTSPTTFTINGFSTFTPATGNPKPAAVYFSFSDDSNSTSRTQCVRTGDIYSTEPTFCADGRTTFTFVDRTLTIGELVTSCTTGTESRIYGTSSISTYCIPSQPPQPNGFGTQCLTPTGQVSGNFHTAGV